VLSLAIFDLDRTLTTRHLWNELGYHRRGAEDLAAQTREQWVEDLGGVARFDSERLAALFSDLAARGSLLAIATYNREHVARAFLRAFDLERFFHAHGLFSRDTLSGSKAGAIRRFAELCGTHPATVQGRYYDDSLEECEDVKALFSQFEVFHVEQPLSAPDARVRRL
jgi:hypothetical protein